MSPRSAMSPRHSPLGRTLALAFLAFAGTLASGCGLPEEQAREWCEDLRARDQAGGTCLTDEAIEECVSCYTRCGRCEQITSCPQQFVCPGESPVEGAE